jgi:hypothetical protein
MKSLTVVGRGNFHLTSIVEDFRMIFVTTPGEEFTSAEKIFLPFDTETWAYLSAYFGIAFAVIFIVNQMPIWVMNQVYGVGVRSADLNVISIFFGVAQPKVPGNNFGRIILVYFIVFCLIIRTAYQGKCFKLNGEKLIKNWGFFRSSI